MTSIENGETRRSSMAPRNILARRRLILGELLGRLDSAVERVDDTYDGDWFDGLGIFARRLVDFSLYFSLVIFQCQWDEDGTGVHLG